MMNIVNVLCHLFCAIVLKGLSSVEPQDKQVIDNQPDTQ